MNPFKSFCLMWWQVVLWKVTMVSFGVAIGANWPHAFAPWTGRLVLAAIAGGGYLAVVWLSQ